jgi:hypothetical protein
VIGNRLIKFGRIKRLCLVKLIGRLARLLNELAIPNMDNPECHEYLAGRDAAM